MSSHHHIHHQSGRNLKIAFFLNLGFTVLEVIGGFFVNSVAILSDALHDLGDSLSLGISWYLNKKAQKEAINKFTFGYSRFSLLGALINSLVLIGGSIYIIIEAVGRILDPQHSDAQGMIVFAIVGIAINGYAAWKLSSGKTLNERVVSWHLMEENISTFNQILEVKRKAKQVLQPFRFSHYTIEIELDDETCELVEKENS
jgi:cobalt-zinc-cadmium efflux system protein